MMNLKLRSPGLSFIEVLIALAFFAIVCSVLLLSQGRSVATGMRALHEQQVVMHLLHKFVELDRLSVNASWCPKKGEEELAFPAPVGTVTCKTAQPSEKSEVNRYKGVKRDELEALWMSNGREMNTRLIRFRFDPGASREA